jgi:hypothetical protein
MREYSFAEMLILMTLIIREQKETSQADELSSELKELQELEAIGWLPPGTANRAYQEYIN